MNFDYYLFDLDGCLLDIPNLMEYFDHILINTLEKISIKILPERQERNKFWYSGNNYSELLEKWGFLDYTNFWKYFDESDFEQRKILIANNKIHLFTDVKRVLKKIHDADKILAIISNSADYIVKFVVDKFSIGQYFHYLFGLSFDKDQSIAKPSPTGIKTVLENLNYDPKKSSAIIVGDSMLDIISGKRAGIHACLIRRDKKRYNKEYSNWKYQPDFVIDELDELLRF
jgi:phosphoglycolate phosphatase-like HAD superfamily hydrolase